MSENTIFCNRCGAALQPTSLFCPNCGQRVSESAPLYPPTQKMPEPEEPAANTYSGSLPNNDPINYAAPYQAGPSYPDLSDQAPKRRSSLPLIIGGIVLAICLCATVIIVGTGALLASGSGGLAALLASPTPTSTNTPTPLPPTATPTATATLPPAPPTPADVPPVEPTPENGNGGEVKWSDNPFIDDFSADKNWPLVNTPDEPTYSVMWMGQNYSMNVKTPSLRVWVFPPTSYDPTNIEFDAQVPPTFNGQHGGTFGVLCMFIDSDNYHNVELDVFNDSYAISKVVNDQRTSLTSDNWLPFNEFNKGAGAVNRVQVTCENNSLTLYINGTFVTTVDDPEGPGSGRTALTTATYEEADPTGFEIWIDNVTASMPAP